MARRYLSWKGGAGVAYPPSSAVTPPGFVQSPGFTASTTTNSAATSTLGAGATAGNLIIMVVNAGAVVSPPSGFSTAQGGTNFTDCRIFFKIAAGGETALSASLASAEGWVAWSAEYSGTWVSPADVGATTNTAASGTSIPTGTTGSPAGSGELAVAAIGINAAAPTVPSVTGAWTLAGTLGSGTPLYALAVATIVGTADALPLGATFTTGSAVSNSVGVVAALKVG